MLGGGRAELLESSEQNGMWMPGLVREDEAAIGDRVEPCKESELHL